MAQCRACRGPFSNSGYWDHSNTAATPTELFPLHSRKPALLRLTSDGRCPRERCADAQSFDHFSLLEVSFLLEYGTWPEIMYSHCRCHIYNIYNIYIYMYVYIHNPRHPLPCCRGRANRSTHSTKEKILTAQSVRQISV